MGRVAKIAGWRVPDAKTNVHVAIGDMYEALTAYWYDGNPPRRKPPEQVFFGRAGSCDIGHMRVEGKLTTTEWALELEGPLVGQILNGGFDQFVDNCPFVLDETASMLKKFGPRGAAESFWALVGPFSKKMQPFRQKLLANSCADDSSFWDDVDELLERHYFDIVPDEASDHWAQQYLGGVDLYGEDAHFGEPKATEPWATTTARAILNYAIDHASSLGVDLEYDP